MSVSGPESSEDEETRLSSENGVGGGGGGGAPKWAIDAGEPGIGRGAGSVDRFKRWLMILA